MRTHLDALATEPLPEQIGPYRIVRELGAGGMGVVYLAAQSEPLERTVALKVIRLGMNSVEIVRRFERERQTLARLTHPGIAQVYDAGTTDNGRPYFALEHVDGRSITEYADTHRLTIEARLRLLIDACAAVEHAHQRGVIHRDIKPSNLLVTEIDGRPSIKVIDFGIAKAVGEDEQEATRLTLAGSLVGTPAYMSPEQATGAAADLDTRTDIFALGAVLYELLVGTPPVDTQALQAAGPLEVRRMITQNVPPAPSTRASELTKRSATRAAQRGAAPEAWVRDLKGDLDWITMKALDKERERRYASAGAFADDLGRFLRDEAIEARPPSRRYKLRKFAARNRGLLIGAGLLLATLVGGLLVSTTLYVEAEEARGLAQSRLDRIERHADQQILGDLEGEAERLWPAWPERLPDLADWLRRARALTARLPKHRARLEALRARGTPTQRDPDDADLMALDDLRREEFSRLRALGGLSAGSDWAPAAPPDERPLTYYARHAFTLDAPPREAFRFSWHAFVGGVLYLNGQELDRMSLPEGPVRPDTRAVGPVVTEPRLAMIEPDLLRAGSNVLAAEIHMKVPSSVRMQLTFDMSDADGRHVVPMDAEWLTWRGEGPPPETWNTAAGVQGWVPKRGPIGFHRPEGYTPDMASYAEQVRQDIERIRGLKRPLEARLASSDHWGFEERRDQIEHDELTRLIAGLERMLRPEVRDTHTASIAQVEARREAARTLRARTVEAYAEAWARARHEVELSPRYGGLELTPQLGLVPLGVDPQSGWQEFALPELGALPVRGASGELSRPDDGAPVLVLVPGGTFQMGARRPAPDDPSDAPQRDPMAFRSEGPIHAVTLHPYLLSKYELTQAQWVRLTGTNPSTWAIGRRAGARTVTARNPVESISWATAKRRLAQVGLRLPTEAQWEYAVRAGTTTPWWCGQEPTSLQDHANVADLSVIENGEAWAAKAWDALDDGFVVHAPAGTFAPNPWGFHETLGNVREWCLDRVGPYLAPVRRGDGLRMELDMPDLVVTRGASYSGRVVHSRTTSRGRTKASVAETWVGVRPARPLVP